MFAHDERIQFRKDYENGGQCESIYLAEYRMHRDNELWRSTREIERICEYILYLEDKLKDD